MTRLARAAVRIRSKRKGNEMKVKKFYIESVFLTVEYKKPILGRLDVLLKSFKFVRLRRISLIINSGTVCNFYVLFVPYFVKGGFVHEEQ